MNSTHTNTSGITIIMCGRGRREQCACGAEARVSCAVDGCGKPLCDHHARKVGNEPRCAKHAPMTINASMPRPPTKKVVEEE